MKICQHKDISPAQHLKIPLLDAYELWGGAWGSFLCPGVRCCCDFCFWRLRLAFGASEHLGKPVDSHNFYSGKMYFFKDIEVTVFGHNIFCTSGDSAVHKLIVVGIGCD